MSPPTSIDPIAPTLTGAPWVVSDPVASEPAEEMLIWPDPPPFSPEVLMSPPTVTGLPLRVRLPAVRGEPVPPLRSILDDTVSLPVALSVRLRPFVQALSPEPGT